jgi:hypothetical protein
MAKAKKQADAAPAAAEGAAGEYRWTKFTSKTIV